MEYAAQDAGVQEACAILENLSANDQVRREAEARIKVWRDEQDRLEGAREEGWEKGREKGREEGWEEGELNNRKKTALILLETGTSEDIIKKATGFTISDIKNFK